MKDISDSKKWMRHIARNWLAAQDPALLVKHSEAICSKILRLEAFHPSASVLVYMPRWDEPDLRPVMGAIWKAGGRVCLPRFNDDSGVYDIVSPTESEVVSMKVGKYGIPEPPRENAHISPKILDFCLIPGLVFGCDGTRLGRGMGYFDRLLAEFSGFRLGVCFDGQLVPSVPYDSHDVHMDKVCTETRIVPGSMPGS